jgi:hypothetical protein
MRRSQFALLLSTLILAVSAPVAVQAAARQAACGAIRAACEQAGFVVGGARAGDGLFMHCIAPIMRQGAQPSSASKPLPKVDMRLVADCKVQNPNFGQRMAPRTPEPTVQASPRATNPQVAPTPQRSSPQSQSSESPFPPSPAHRLETPRQSPEHDIEQE